MKNEPLESQVNDDVTAKLAQLSTPVRLVKKVVGFLILVMVAIGLYQWLSATMAESAFSLSDWTINQVEKLNWQVEGRSQFLNILILFSFLSLATSIGLPRQIAALVAGINLGVWLGVLVATMAATLGCLITFCVSRYLLSKKIAQKYPTQLNKLSTFLGEQTFLKAVVIRIFPLGSNFITNIIAGVSKVSMPAYVSGSFVGFIPQMLIFSLAGSGIRLGAQTELIASGVLFIVALLISTYLFKKHNAKNKLHQ